MFDKKELLKVANEVKEQGVTTSAHKDIIKKAQMVKMASIIAFIKNT